MVRGQKKCKKKIIGSSSGITPKSRKSYEVSISFINALIESCAKTFEASAYTSPGDDIEINLLASVASGEISKSDIVSLLSFPGRNSPVPEDSCSGDDAKLTQLDEDIGQTQNQPNDGAIGDTAAERGNSNDSSRLKNGLRHSSAPVAIDISGDNKTCEKKIGECSAQLNSSSMELQQNRNPSLLLAANKVFGSDYDAYCLSHLKESLDYFINSNPILKMGHLKSVIDVKLELKIMIWLEVDISKEIPSRSVGPNDPELEEQIIQHMATALANAPPD
ncbi:hypothetical protein VitviT2T_026410 [Vitis vinifera]|uniref:Uncharacterized protein n=1 Tax=Vitis vinifera TaxID=29760 RepID=A0ABY9DP86_VITVI|nr:hypothetical protein VitviT2T_026410 [Vitis vinifera]